MVLTHRVPWAMILARALLCPAIVVGAMRGWDGRWLGAIVLFALVDDILDGMLARRWECDTSSLRLADSLSDTVFYLGAAWALWIREPQVLRENRWLLAVLFSLEIVRYIFDLWKFRKGASYHSYLAKAWGLVMAIAIIGVLSFGGLSWLIRISILVGIFANLEGLVMSLLLPRWKNDVRTLAACWRLRRKILAGEVR